MSAQTLPLWGAKRIWTVVYTGHGSEGDVVAGAGSANTAGSVALDSLARPTMGRWAMRLRLRRAQPASADGESAVGIDTEGAADVRATSAEMARRHASIDRLGWWAPALALVSLYVASALLLLRLDTGVIYPFYLPDESQYAVVGQNLLTLHAFRYEGQFPLLVPPLYPLLVALGRALSGVGGMSTWLAAALNHFIMCAVIFPAYALARQLRLARGPALLIALAAAWVPNMWEAGHYMAEVIYYPLFVASCLAVVAYFQRPTAWRAIVAGGALGLALLTKNTAAAPLLAWGLASGALLLLAYLRERPALHDAMRWAPLRAYALWPAVGAAVAGLLYAPWLLLRRASLAGCGAACGGEASVFQQALKHPMTLARFLPLYASDMFLGVGALVLPLALLGWYRLARKGSEKTLAQAAFLGLSVVIVIAMTALFSGYTTQQLRERHMFVLTPVLLALAGCGLPLLRKTPAWKLIAVFGFASLAQVALLFALDFTSGPTLVNAPWAYGLGYLVTKYRGVTGVPLNWDATSFMIGLVAVALAFQVVWLFRPAWRATILFAVTCALLIATFLPVLSTLNTLETYDRTDRYAGMGALSQWLISTIGPGQTLLFYGCDPLSPCSSQRPSAHIDALLFGYGPNHLDIYYAEAAGMYEMAPVTDLSQLAPAEANEQAAYLLSPVMLIGLPEVGHFGIIRLYDLSGYRASLTSPPPVTVATSAGCYAEVLSPLHLPTSAPANTTFTVQVVAHNISPCQWSEVGADRVWISYRWRATPGGRLLGAFVNAPASLPRDVAPGKSVTASLTVTTPPTSGPAVLEIDMVVFPGAGSFEQEGGTPAEIPMTIQP